MMMMELGRPNRISKKRKAENNSDNERLSKRLSLLNLERNGQKLYVPVEAPSSISSSSASSNSYTNAFTKPFTQTPSPPSRRNHNSPNLVKPVGEEETEEDIMQLDNTKHKVYIYDLDAELSDSDDTSDDGRLVFLPDIAKHLRETRIPPSVRANQDGELAGVSREMVLYHVPSSLTVPEEQDGVRKAIIEARARMRAKMEGRGDDEVMVRDGNGSGCPGGGREELGNEQTSWDVPETIVEDDVDAMDLG